MVVAQAICPHCRTTVKSVKPIPLGQQINCPGCRAAYQVTPQNLQTIQPVSATPPVPASRPQPPVLPGPVSAAVPTPTKGMSRGAMAGVIAGVVLFIGTGVGLAIWCFSAGTDEPAPSSPPHTERPVKPPVEQSRPVKQSEKLLVVLPPIDQDRVEQAIKRGMEFLKKTQDATSGTWPGGRVACTALPALTLLECGVPKTDPVIARAAAYVRKKETWASLNTTYDLAVTILFLDRLGVAQDKDLIRTLTFRLVAGQTMAGGWSYTCPVLEARDQQQLESVLEANQVSSLKLKPVDYSKLGGGVAALAPSLRTLAVLQTPPPNDAPLTATGDDNSNTQFAILALWSARKHGVPLDRTLAWVVKRFRTSQNADGSWGYYYRGGLVHPTQAMTCAGLLGLAVGLGLSNEARAQEKGGFQAPAKDPDVQKAIAFLSKQIEGPTERWQLVSRVIDGKPAAGEQFTLTITGTRYIAKLGEKEVGQGTFTIDRTRKPITIDRTVTAGPDKGTTALGILEITGNSIKICWAPPGKVRPTEFVSKPGSGHVLEVFNQTVPMKDLYYLWSIERVAVIFHLPKIGDKEWYPWGAEILATNQGADGSWFYHNAQVGTSLGLLFLKRANLAKGLEKLMLGE